MNRYFQTPPVVKNLIIINVLVYMATALLPVGDTIMQYCALSLGTPYFHTYQFITYMFLHANFEHIFFNMFALWMFGRTLEYELGQKRFLTYYMVCGIGAALIQYLTALAFGLGTALSWNVVNIELVGTQAAPAVVITRREQAVVLFRGSSITQRAVENQLEKRGVRTVELLVDLRVQPEEPCRIEAQKRINAAALAENTTRCASCGEVDLELFRTRQGCILRMRVGGQRFITLSGTVRPAKPIRAEWLLASMARPDNIRYTDCLTLSRKYRWMRESDAVPVSRLRLRLAG